MKKTGKTLVFISVYLYHGKDGKNFLSECRFLDDSVDNGIVEFSSFQPESKELLETIVELAKRYSVEVKEDDVQVDTRRCSAAWRLPVS